MSEFSQFKGRQPVLLVVEEEEGIRQLLNRAMGQYGFTVLLAANGNEALEVYGKEPAGVDLVLLDVRMSGLDGPQTLARLQQINPSVRVCFMSGDTAASRGTELMAQGALHVFRKPFASLSELGQDLKGFLKP